MTYTNYYSTIIKAQGMPHISVAQHQKIMNIVHLEGALSHLVKLKCDGQSQVNKSKYIYQLTAKLYNLTKNETPEAFFKELFQHPV